MNLKLINYIKLREAWKETLRVKSHSLASVWSGLFNFAIFLAYWAIEKIFLKKEIEGLYQQNPNYKYIFYFSLVLGIWGLVNAYEPPTTISKPLSKPNNLNAK